MLRNPRRLALLAALGCAASACEAVPVLLPAAMNFAKNLLDTSSANYGKESADELRDVLGSFFEPRQTGTTASARAAPAIEPEAAVNPLGLEVALLRDDTPFTRGILGGNSRLQLADLEANPVLRDGVGREESGDRLRVSFTPTQDCWVYVIEVDATGYVQPVFPNPYVSAETNPVAAGTTVLIPDGNEAFELDGYRGEEHFFFLASRSPRHDLERQLKLLQQREVRPEPQSTTTVQSPIVASRGIQGGSSRARRRETVATQDGAKAEVSVEQWLGEVGADEIVVSLPFQHR
jgi:hypothetical protein